MLSFLPLVAAMSLSTPAASNETLTLGGGCFWCLEAVYADVRGVSKVTSGYAGGTDEKPVGLVYIALADDVQAEAKQFTLFGSRIEIRQRASQVALDWVRRRYLL